MKLFAVIMAGGHGERFWPLSRRSRPKQLLRLLGTATMLENTVFRLSGLVGPEQTLVITGAEHLEPIRRLLPALPADQIIGEPMRRDTGVCLALAAAVLRHRAGEDAVMLTLPADHAIADSEAFRVVLRDVAAYAAAHPRALVTIGLKPTYAATGYGYIRCGESGFRSGETGFHQGLEFREKPDLKTAERYLADPNYRWNSGIFAWTVGAIRHAMAVNAPDLAALEERFFASLQRGALDEELSELYAAAPRISIDYAILEKSREIVVADGNFPWDDLGSWTALRQHLPPDADGNVRLGRSLGVDTENSIIIGDDRHLITTLGVKNLIIVHSDDVTLVADADAAQRLKELLTLFDSPELREFL